MHLTVGVIAQCQGKILVIKNKYSQVYRPVTGFVEVAERPEVAAIREFKEETGLAAEIDKLLGVYNVGKKVNNVLIVYTVKRILVPGCLIADDIRFENLATLLNQEKDPGFKQIYKDYAKILSGRKS